MASFYDKPLDPAFKVQFDADVKQAILDAQEIQNQELAKLGLGGARQDDAGFSGGGVIVTRNSGVPLGSPKDIEAMLKHTSATPLGAPFMAPTPGQGR